MDSLTAIAPSPGAFSQDRQELHALALALGFEPEAELLSSRTGEQPFTLLIAGTPGAGASLLANVLLGRAVARRREGRTWLNLYCRTEGEERAEVHSRTHPLRRLPLAEALALVQDPEADLQDVDTITWHVTTPGLPEGVRLAEPPLPKKGLIDPRSYWQADGLLWSIDLEALQDADPATLIPVRQNAGLPTLCVVLHMEALARTAWSSTLRHIRLKAGERLDHIVPFALSGPLMPSTISLLRRETRNRFFRNSREHAGRSQATFLDSMRGLLAARFETYVDDVLRDRWSSIEADRTLSDRLAGEAARIDRQALRMLRTWAADVSQRQEAAEDPCEMLRVRLAAYLRQVQQRLQRMAEHALAATPLATADAPTRLTISFPDRPAALTALLEAPPALSTAAPAGRFNPDTEQIEAHTPRAAEAWVPGDAWIDTVLHEAHAALQAWFQDARACVEAATRQALAAQFEARYGFAPDHAATVLRERERAYIRLADGEATMPVPPGLAALSPVEFLCKLQEEGFAAEWNSALFDTCYRTAQAQLQQRAERQIDRTRNFILDAWERQRLRLEADLRKCWKAQDRPLALPRRSRRPAPSVQALVQDALQPSRRRFTLSRLAGTAPATGASFYLGPKAGSFLRPRRQADPDVLPAPELLLATRLKEEILRKAETLWAETPHLALPNPLHRRVRQRVGWAMIPPVGAGVALLASFGAGPITLGVLLVLIALHARATWHWLHRFVRRHREDSCTAQADVLYEHVRTVLNDRAKQLRRHVRRVLQNPHVRAEIERAVFGEPTRRGAGYLSYGDLQRRLCRLRPA